MKIRIVMYADITRTRSPSIADITRPVLCTVFQLPPALPLPAYQNTMPGCMGICARTHEPRTFYEMEPLGQRAPHDSQVLSSLRRSERSTRVSVGRDDRAHVAALLGLAGAAVRGRWLGSRWLGGRWLGRARLDGGRLGGGRLDGGRLSGGRLSGGARLGGGGRRGGGRRFGPCHRHGSCREFACLGPGSRPRDSRLAREWRTGGHGRSRQRRRLGRLAAPARRRRRRRRTWRRRQCWRLRRSRLV